MVLRDDTGIVKLVESCVSRRGLAFEGDLCWRVLLHWLEAGNVEGKLKLIWVGIAMPRLEGRHPCELHRKPYKAPSQTTTTSQFLHVDAKLTTPTSNSAD